MRRLACGLALAAGACGSSKSKPKDGGPPPEGGPPPIDAPALAACSPTSGTTMSTRMIGRVNGSAIIAASPPHDGRLFVIEQAGRIRIFQNEQLRPDPFLDVSGIQSFAAGGEQGLLGLAFHPDYAHNNYFYVWYTTGSCTGSPPAALPCANVLERFTASATDLNKADPNSGVVLLTIPDFAANHNAGMIEFGNDGYLYVSTGDGGAGGDPARNGQNPSALLGKILRLDVDHPSNGKPYGIPADNPYAAGGGAPEVFILGVRNPWRWSFDRANGDMWIGDVGHNLYEEIDYLPAGQQKGVNLGWSMYEANSCYGNYTCSPAGMTMPQFVHAHTNGWTAIIGGSVYRGPCYPDLTGYYFFSDYSGNQLMRTRPISGTAIETPVDVSPAGGFPAGSSSIHADARGELYVTTIDGYVWHLEAGP
ncbi:MAG: PQQ-dependent sugar dehydrogenase [Acidobacteriota bacterium]